MAVVETNGTVSVYQKAPARPVTCEDLQLSVQNEDPPEVLIADGCISEEGLSAASITPAQLHKMLKRKHLRTEDVFLLTADASGICSLVKKEGAS